MPTSLSALGIKIHQRRRCATSVPVKLFAYPFQRQSKQARNALRDAGVQFDEVNLRESFYGYTILESLTGEMHTPYLFVNGVGYRGLEGVRAYLAR